MFLLSSISASNMMGLLLLLLFAATAQSSNTFNLDVADKYVHFSGAAYCAHPRFKKEQVENWSCKACKKYPGMEAKTFSSKRECIGFVGYYPADNEIVVSFSGTNPLNIRQWLDDLDFFKTDYPLCTDTSCKVHEGFYNTYLSAVDDIRNLTKSYLDQYPTASITCTGHSLGAALASFCAADLHAQFSSSYPDLVFTSPYTYGLPRVGDEAYSSWFKSNSLPFDAYRVVHRKDPVPHVPLQSMGFHHFPYEVFYVKDYSEYTVCSSSGEDPDCSDQYTVDLDVLNHLNYLGFDFTTNFLDCEL